MYNKFEANNIANDKVGIIKTTKGGIPAFCIRMVYFVL